MALQLDKQAVLDFGRLSLRLHWLFLAITLPLMYFAKLYGWLHTQSNFLFGIFALMACANLAVYVVLRRWHVQGNRVSLESVTLLRRLSTIFDVVVFAALIHATAGVESPLFPLFLIGCVFLSLMTSASERVVVFGIAYTLLVMVVGGEYLGYLDHYAIGTKATPGYYRSLSYVGLMLFFWAGLLIAALQLVHLVRLVLERRDAQLEENRLELRRIQAFQNEVLEQLPVGVVVFGRGGQISGINKVARALLEFTKEENRNLLRLKAIETSGLTPYIERVIEGESLELIDFPYEYPDTGQRMWFKLAGVPPQNGQDGILVLHDTTEAKNREDSEREIQDRLSQADKFTSLGQMASGVAHELNNPLTAILSTAQFLQYLIRENRLDLDVVKEKSADIVVHGTRIEQLVRGLVSYAKPGSGEHQHVVVRTVVDELLSFSAFELRRGNIDLKYEIKDVNDFLCSKIDLQQLILNLMSNARQAFGDASGQVELRIGERTVGGLPCLSIEVEDDGPGISSEKLDRIFEPFFTTKGELGTGLGLAIVQALVERYSGEIHVDSIEGRGTTFTIDLPYQDELDSWDPVGDQTFSPYR